jgi:molybdopterin converting factor small subunit
MAQVTLTRHLQRFFPTLKEVEEVPGATVRELLDELDRRYPGLAAYIVDETGRVRRHVNVFVREEPIYDRESLADKVAPGDKVHILQALSGG